MAQREKLEIGNNILDADSEFTEGYANGNLYYYDTNNQLQCPFTSEALYAFMMENLADQRATAHWNAGFVFGWITAMCENNPEFFFKSIVISDSTIVTELSSVVALQEA